MQTLVEMSICLTCTQYLKSCENLRLYHASEDMIEKSFPWIADWHHEACRVMANGDPEGRIFLSYPHTNDSFSCLPLVLYIYMTIPVSMLFTLTNSSSLLVRVAMESKAACTSSRDLGKIG